MTSYSSDRRCRRSRKRSLRFPAGSGSVIVVAITALIFFFLTFFTPVLQRQRAAEHHRGVRRHSRCSVLAAVAARCYLVGTP